MDGRLGSAYEFDGTDDYVDLPASALPEWWTSDGDREPVTVATWFRTSGSGLLLGNEGKATPDPQGSENGWVPALYVGDSGKLHASTFWHGNPTDAISSPGSYDDGSWHHAVATFEDGTQTLYVDGQRVAQQTGLAQTDYNSGTYYYFLGAGRWDSWPGIQGNSGEYLDGRLDEFRAAATDRSAAWVETAYTVQNDSASYWTVGTVDDGDTAPPRVNSIARSSPASRVTDADSVTFQVQFNESVSGIDASDFDLDTSGGVTGTVSGVSASSGSSVTVTVTSVGGSGTLGLHVASGTDITDDFGNTLRTVEPGTDEGYTVDNTAPTVTVSQPTAGAVLQGGAGYTVEWTTAESESTIAANTVDLEYSTDGGSTWTTIGTGLADDGSERWSVPAVDASTVRVRVSASDRAGNVGHDTTGDLTVDSTAPTVGDVAVSNPDGQDVRVTVTSDEQLATVRAAVTGAASATLSTAAFTESGGDPYTYTATYAGSVDGTYEVRLERAVDAAGNDGASGESRNVVIETGPDRSGKIPPFLRADVGNDDGSGETVGSTGPGRSPDDTAPSVTGFTVTNPSGRIIRVSFNSSEPLAVVRVSLTGTELATLYRGEFTRNGSMYVGTYEGTYDGRFVARLAAAKDSAGNDGATGQSGTVTVSGDGRPKPDESPGNATVTNRTGGEEPPTADHTSSDDAVVILGIPADAVSVAVEERVDPDGRDGRPRAVIEREYGGETTGAGDRAEPERDGGDRPDVTGSDALVTAGERLTLSAGQSRFQSTDGLADEPDVLKRFTVTTDRPAGPATVRTSVNRARLDGREASAARIGRHTEAGWRLLETTVVRETNTTVVLEARTQSLSTFAVVVPHRVSYTWTLPNGTRLDGRRVNVTVTEPGRHRVELTVTDNRGRSDTATYRVRVNDRPTVTVETPDVIRAGEPVTLRADVTDRVGARVVTWQFPGGDTATGETVTRAFPAGEHELRVVVRDEYGATGATRQVLSVRATNASDGVRDGWSFADTTVPAGVVVAVVTAGLAAVLLGVHRYSGSGR
jgi:hypothetical protein